MSRRLWFPLVLGAALTIAFEFVCGGPPIVKFIRFDVPPRGVALKTCTATRPSVAISPAAIFAVR